MSGQGGQLALPFAPIVRPLAAGLIAAPSNAAARAWLDRPAEWPQRRLAVWGPPGCGKSRLLGDWAAGQGGVLLDGASLRFEPVGQPLAQPLAIDDAHRAPPRALLHMLNAAHEAGWPVLLAAALPPARWPVTLADLASRLRAAAAVPIGAPEDDLLRLLLARLLAERQLRVPEALQRWLLARLPRTHLAVCSAVARLDQAGQSRGVAVSRALALHALPDLLTDLTPDNEEPAENCSLVTEDFTRLPFAASPQPGALL